MITKIYGVYDSKALCFGTPFFAVTAGAAIRMFADAANDPNTMLHKHSSDFVLYEIGSFDDNSGLLVSHSKHLHLGLGSDYRNSISPVVENAVGLKNGEVNEIKVEA